MLDIIFSNFSGFWALFLHPYRIYSTINPMDITLWKERLSKLPLGEIYLYPELGSTNQVAEEKIVGDCPPFSLVVADSQTEGKGRLGRHWVTRAGKALALSWILYPEPGRIQPETLGRVSGLGPVAVAEVLREIYSLPAEIKWPNDVLVHGKKTAGVLVDVRWNGCQLTDVVLGIGINVARDSVPPQEELNFPATSLEDAAGTEISRLDLLIQIMETLIKWYTRLAEPSFIKAWDSMLAYKGQRVKLTTERGLRGEGKIAGISEDGSLRLFSEAGEENEYHSGEIQLRLVDIS